jgi:hypothetical protein
MDWNPYHEAIKALFSLGSAAVVLLLTWVVGQRLTYSWNVKQKRREFQLAASQQFYSAYGEFFATWKLWNRLSQDSPEFDQRQWELHKRAAAAEAIIEGVLVKLSAELNLADHEIDTLGQFRQGFQRLREAIQDQQHLPWHDSEHPEYKAFKTLTIRVADLLTKDWPKVFPSPQRAAAQFTRITSNAWEGKWFGDKSPANLSHTAPAKHGSAHHGL